MIRTSIVVMIACASVAVAQKSDTSPVCWTAHPLAICKSWMITEVGVDVAVQTSHPPGVVEEDVKHRAAASLGLMLNTGERNAVGVVRSWTTETRWEAAGEGRRLELRYRRWTDHMSGLDLSAGRATSVDGHGEAARGLTGRVGVEVGWAGFGLRSDWMHTSRGRPVKAVIVDARAGQKVAGAAVAVALGFLFLAVTNYHH